MIIIFFFNGIELADPLYTRYHIVARAWPSECAHEQNSCCIQGNPVLSRFKKRINLVLFVRYLCSRSR